MASSLGNNTIASPFATVIEENILSHFTSDWSDRLNLEEIFLLIDGALPFEVCLYYQVLPLSIEANILHLGAVSPEDDTAFSYVSRMVSYLNYSIAIHPITSEALQTILSNYLKQTGSQPATLNKQREVLQQHATQPASAASLDRTIIDRTTLDRTTLDRTAYDTTIELEHPSQPKTQAQVEVLQVGDRAHCDTTIGLTTRLDTTFIEPQDDEGELETESESDDLELVGETTVALNLVDLIATRSTESSSQEASGRTGAIAALPVNDVTGIMLSLMPALPQLNLNIEQFSQSAAELKQLPPLDMLRELLARILEGGIGRLYFECHERCGKILWSQDGVVKSALNDLPLDTLQDVIDELKQLAQLPILATQETQQPEVEYQYEQTRVLLRFRFMRNDYGEEATVQVLKGAALKFYQQQQLVRLERDAVTIAKQLQIKLHEIRDRVHSQSELAAARFEILPELSRVLQNIDAQLSELGLE